MKRNVSTAVAALALAGCLVPVAAFAADSAWSMDADCASCHAKEAQTHVVIEDAEDAGAADVGDAAKPASKDAAASEPTAAGADPLPLAAVHQAVPCTGCHSDEKVLSTVHDGVTADSKLPKRLRKRLEEANCNIFSLGLLEEEVRDFAEMQALSPEPYALFFEPASMLDRIANQYALFSVVSDPGVLLSDILEQQEIDYYKIIIPREVKLEIRDKLDYINISERMLYPGLDGICRWIARQYSALGPKYNRRSDASPPNA